MIASFTRNLSAYFFTGCYFKTDKSVAHILPNYAFIRAPKRIEMPVKCPDDSNMTPRRFENQYVLFRKLVAEKCTASMLLQNRHVVPRLIYLDLLHFHPQVIIFQCVNKCKS